jgi:TM2 domain-containing membrane protein YozV
MDDRYYIAIGPEQKGPYTFGQLQSMWRSGMITADALYCQDGFAEWLPISSIAHLLNGQPLEAPSLPNFPTSPAADSDKRILPALILCFFLGYFGAHAFYAGRRRQGILFLVLPASAVVLTIITGLCLSLDLPYAMLLPRIEAVILALAALLLSVFVIGDLIRILIGAYKDGAGRKIQRWT